MSCEKVTYLMEKDQLSRLSFIERVKVRWHKVLCGCCRNYEKDSHALNRIMQRLHSEQPSRIMSDSDKSRIKQKLDTLDRP